MKELSQGFRRTTNNRMELLAVIYALENLKTNKYPVHIYSDSKYVIDAISKKWVFGWEKKNFKGKKVNFIITDYGKLSKNIERMVENLEKKDDKIVR